MGINQYIGEIAIYPYNFAPRDWVYCDGQLLRTEQFSALYSLLGDTFGGDGRTTFAVPNLNGRAVIGTGNFFGRQYIRGNVGGKTSITLTNANLPSHTHPIEVNCQGALGATNEDGDRAEPGPDSILAKDVDTTGGAHPVMAYAQAGRQNTTLGGLNVAGEATCHTTGQSQEINIRNPFLVLAFCIAVDGIFPPRS
jgi:microcystin-dependent protein